MDIEADLRLNPPFRTYRCSWYGEEKYEPPWMKDIDPDKYYVVKNGKFVEAPILGFSED